MLAAREAITPASWGSAPFNANLFQNPRGKVSVPEPLGSGAWPHTVIYLNLLPFQCPAWVRQCFVTAHCKNIRISTDILRRVFRILMEPVPYTFLSVNRRNNEARFAMQAWASLFRRFTFRNVYGTGSVKIRKLAAKYLWIFGHFLPCRNDASAV